MEAPGYMTPSEYLMEALSKVEDAESVLIVIRHKDKGISFGTSDNCKYTAYALARITAAYVEADMVSENVKEIVEEL
jgi:hypothetical protein